MKRIGKKYNLYDPKRSDDGDCLNCSELYCNFVHCKVFDADGDTIVPVIIAASGNIPERKYYKKEGTQDTLAVEPYSSNAPCCYKAEITGVGNNSSDLSWCEKCEQLNDEFLGNFYATETYDWSKQVLGQPGDHPFFVDVRLIFPLCVPVTGVLPTGIVSQSENDLDLYVFSDSDEDLDLYIKRLV